MAGLLGIEKAADFLQGSVGAEFQRFVEQQHAIQLSFDALELLSLFCH
jgi:hypothetical protein